MSVISPFTCVKTWGGTGVSIGWLKLDVCLSNFHKVCLIDAYSLSRVYVRS